MFGAGNLCRQMVQIFVLKAFLQSCAATAAAVMAVAVLKGGDNTGCLRWWPADHLLAIVLTAATAQCNLLQSLAI